MTRVLHVSASFPRHLDDSSAPFLLDLVRVQREHGWEPSVVALHDRGLARRHDLAGVPVRRARYVPDRWEVLAYRGGLVHSLPGFLVHGRGERSSGVWRRALLLPALLVVLVWATTTSSAGPGPTSCTRTGSCQVASWWRWCRGVGGPAR